MSTETHILPSLDLLEFQLFDWLQVNQSDGREIFSAISETARRLAIDKFLPHYRQSDIEEPYLDGEGVHVLPAIQEALGSFADLGFFGASFAEDAGGFGLSFAVSLPLKFFGGEYLDGQLRDAYRCECPADFDIWYARAD